MIKNERAVISVIIEGESEEMKKVNVDAIAERINRLIQGEEVEALTNNEDVYTNCTCCIDPEKIKTFISIGPSGV